MKFDIAKAEQLVACTHCEWQGKLEQTEDMDITDSDLKIIGSTCVCPRCGHEVKEVKQQKSAL